MADLFDAVVVGPGAGGGAVAYVLARRGWSVALVEKGRNPYPTLGTDTLSGSLFGNDEIRGRRYHAFHDPFVEPRVFRASEEAPATIGEAQGLGVGVGGGTVQYDADSPRLQRADLTRLATSGPVEGAEVVDWPISFDDLVPYYDEVERTIGVQGEAGADPFAEPRGPYPMPPGYPSKAGIVLAEGARSLGYHPHPMPMAINSMLYRGRPACVNCGFCTFGCPVNAKGSSAVTFVHDALRTGRVTLFSETCVTAVETVPDGSRATGVRVVDFRGEATFIAGQQVVLAANAIETARLLLASASAVHPDGLGNGSGRVGRCLMFHMVLSAVGVFSEEIRSYRGRPITHAVADFTAPVGPGARRGGYVELGGSMHPVAESSRYPWKQAKALATTGPYRRRLAVVSMIAEDLPVATNRVELDDQVRDVYGRPVARITYARHPDDQAAADEFIPRLAEIASAAGAVSVLPIDVAILAGVPDTKHLLGTTRMGTDPATSVTDPWGRLHEVENVWIADGGTWPTSAAFNPTLTQQALAWRTAGYMADPEDPRP